LAAFDPGLTARVRLVIANKTDLPHDRERLATLRALAPRTEAVSALTGEGVPTLKQTLFELVTTA
jgi:50S ribosomal subunit-associated GTPase HflX